MGKLIGELYTGEITNRVDEMPEDEKLDSIEKIVGEEISYWRDKLPRNEFKRLENKIIDNSNDINGMVMKTSFEKGFKIGIQLLVEALYE